jgi:hypothetical protein
LEEQPADDERSLPEAPDPGAGERRDEEERRRPRQEADSGAERTVVLRRLEELRHEVDGPEQRRREEDGRGVCGREGARAEHPHRQHRRAAAQRAGDERSGEQRSEAQRTDHLGAPPARLVPAYEPPDESECGGGREREPGDVERGVRPEALVDAPQREWDRQQPDRDVQPEDPLPLDPLGDRAAEHGASEDGQAGDRGEDAERARAALGREGGADERERERRDERGAGALNRARRDQRARARRERTPRRRRRTRPRPTANMRRRPSRSPSAAAVSRSTAKLSVYAFTVHSSCSIDAPSSTLILLRAVVTTVASSATISDPTEPRASVHFDLLDITSPFASAFCRSRHRSARRLIDELRGRPVS